MRVVKNNHFSARTKLEVLRYIQAISVAGKIIISEFPIGSTSISVAGCRWFLNDFRFTGHFSRDFRLPKYPAPPPLE